MNRVRYFAALQKEVLACSKPYARFLRSGFRAAEGGDDADAIWDVRRRVLIAALKLQLDHYLTLLDQREVTENVLPPEMIHSLREALLDVQAGEIPPLFAPSRVPGGRGYRNPRRVAMQIDHTVDYLTAAELGLEVDKAPTKTVSEAFSTTVQTVRRWKRDRGSLRQRSRAMEERLGQFRLGRSTYSDSELVTFLMRSGGGLYRDRRPGTRR